MSSKSQSLPDDSGEMNDFTWNAHFKNDDDNDLQQPPLQSMEKGVDSYRDIGQEEVSTSNKSVVIKNEQLLLPTEELFAEKAAICEVSLVEMARLYPHIAGPWKYMVLKYLHGRVLLVSGVTLILNNFLCACVVIFFIRGFL
jgi:hypothetical protein